MLHHFRFILPLLPRDDDGLSALHYYDSAVQLTRHASRECSEAEFLIGLSAADEIKKMYVLLRCYDDHESLTHYVSLNECRLEMLEGSINQYSDGTRSSADH